MKFTQFTSLAVSLVLLVSCDAKDVLRSSASQEPGYQPSSAHQLPMTFPGKDQTVSKDFYDFKAHKRPARFTHPNSWVIYMAAPGWTNGGAKIADRTAYDASAVWQVKQFIKANKLTDKVRVAWLQYDPNPNPRFVESLDLVPDNFIPLFLKMHGPQVDFFVYSPASRRATSNRSMTYDQWLKPYLSFAEKKGNTYVTGNASQEAMGFNDSKSEYWDSWARHWFVVNPDGIVVDAYFSNLGTRYIQGPDKPIYSLIHHLGLNQTDLSIPKVVSGHYRSLYTLPYWDKADADFRRQLGMSK